MRTRDEFIDQLEQQIARMKQVVAEAETAIPAVLPEGVHHWVSLVDGEWWIRFPWNWTKYRQVRRQMGPGWKRHRDYYYPEEGKIHITFRHTNGYKATIAMDAAENGAICQLTPVGVKTVPIYEVSCPVVEKATLLRLVG